MRIPFARYFLFAAYYLEMGIIVYPNAARADALDNWTSRIIATNQLNFGLRDMAFGNGRYVIVGDAPCTPDYGTVITSEDGEQWTVRRNGCAEGPTNLYELLAVAYGRNEFVAVGYLGNIYSSIDGLDWVQRAQAPFYNFNGVAYGNGRFVAVGDGQLIAGGTTTTNVYVSLDGTNWSARYFGFSDSLQSIAFNGSVFVATGFGNVYRSTSGTSWTATGVGPSYSRVSACNTLFIIPRGIGTNLVSIDGATWATQTNDSSLQFDRVFYSHGIYLAIQGSTNAFCTSTNGTNWTIRHFPTSPNSSLIGFTFGGPKAVGMASTAAGVVYRVSALTSDPLVGLTALSQPGQLSLTGISGASYRVESSDFLGPTGNSWHALATIILPGSPYLWTDVGAGGVTSRFYRAVLLP